MAPQRRRRRSGRPACVAAGVVAWVVLVSGPGYAVGAGPVRADDASTPGPTALTTSGTQTKPVVVPSPPVPSSSAAPAVPSVPGGSPAPSRTTPVAPVAQGADPVEDFPAFGAYLDYGPLGLARMAWLSDWLGGAELRVAHTYLPGDRWSNIEGRPGFLGAWADWRRERDDRTFVLNVPMLERNEEGVSDPEVRRLLRHGAEGEFDHHFRTLAERLVELKLPDTVIVLGWEMNGITYTHRCGPDPESWKKYWNRIVTTMRSVPGQKFTFDWTPNRGRDAIPWPRCYPGDDTVDIIGMDSYDQPRGLPFDKQVTEPYGLQAHVDFAKAHGKPISYAEWGLFHNGDNAEYMRGMLAWMDKHRPLYNTLTDYCPHGVWQCTANPKASEVYRSVLSGRTDPAPVPVPATPQPTPTAPVLPPTCSPLNLGEWVEYWLGGKLCLRFDWVSSDR
ncbi:glycoside hydrolase family 26 protein [Streptomyces graminofaciens]|uniref:glycoside hydrolase family 26 protein n=1 Tax=Streptomyces graminofaciens TaxID=68212 RepID=UPI002573B50F|nr:glycosyl hydrolase [Streptomyces graminofaciens]